MHTPHVLRRRVAALLLTVAVTAGGTVVAAAPATAAPASHAPASVAAPAAPVAPVKAASTTASVKFGKVTAKKAPYNGKATITPNVKKSGKVVISKKTLTVKRGSTTVAKNKTSVKLKAGTYRLTQKVTYRTYAIKTTNRKVTRTVVGAPAFEDVAVTCVATAVEPEGAAEGVEPWGALVEATCTSPKFDGERTLLVFLTDEDFGWWGFDEYGLDELTTSTLPTVGVPFPAILNPEDDLMKTKVVTEKVSKRVYSKVKTKTSAPQTLVIRQGKKPSSVTMNGGWNCPAGYPIKGNASSMIYHVRGGGSYKATKPEECFATEAAARAAGYRKARN